jgi:hypothetical protein
MSDLWYTVIDQPIVGAKAFKVLRCKLCSYENSYLVTRIPTRCPSCPDVSLDNSSSFSVIDLTRLEEVSVDELHKWEQISIDMYNRKLKKGELGSANAMYVVNSLIVDEILSREHRIFLKKK